MSGAETQSQAQTEYVKTYKTGCNKRALVISLITADPHTEYIMSNYLNPVSTLSVKLYPLFSHFTI